MQKKKLGIVAFAAMLVAGVVAAILMLPVAQSYAFWAIPEESGGDAAFFKVSKVDDDGEPVGGAELTVTVDREDGGEGRIHWEVSSDKDQYVQESGANGSLPTLRFDDYGKVTITETVTPSGYKTADPVTVEVSRMGENNESRFAYVYGSILINGEIKDDSMQNGENLQNSQDPDYLEYELPNISSTLEIKLVDKKLYEVQVLKVDENGDPLSGATLEITGEDEDGNAIETITIDTSTDNPKTVQLTRGSYTLTETSAPDGYEVADPVTFTVDKDSPWPGDSNYSGPIEVKMTDKKTPTTDDDTPTPTPDPTPEPEPEPEPEPDPTPEPTPEPEPTPTETTTTTESKKAEPVKTLIPATGDIAIQGLTTLTILGAALLATTAILKKRLLD